MGNGKGRKNKKKNQKGDIYLLNQLKRQEKEMKIKYDEALERLNELKRQPKYTKIQELEIQI